MSDSLAKRYPPRKEPPGPLVMPSVARKDPTPLKKVGKGRAARNAAAFGPQAKACRRLPCCVCARTPCDPHHWPSRGAGGKDEDAIPLCRRCHDSFHNEGEETFQRKRNLSLAVIKADLQAAMKAHDCANWPRLVDGGLNVVCALCERESEEPLP